MFRLLARFAQLTIEAGASSSREEGRPTPKVPGNFSSTIGLSDEVDQLVRRAQRGDAAALDGLVAELTPYLGRICGSVALDAGEDALQETMIAIVRNLRSLKDPAALRGWARTIAVREAVRVARSRQRVVPVDPSDLEALAVPDLVAGVDVAQVLEGLAPHHRAILVLRELEGLTEAEAAEVLGVSVGTVKSRTARARRAFRKRWSA